MNYDLLARILAATGEEQSPITGPRAIGAPRRYPGQRGALQPPANLPPRPVPLPQHLRGRSGEPQTWAPTDGGGWQLAPSAPPPPLRVRPGDLSPAGHGNFASWNSALNEAERSGGASSIINRDAPQTPWAEATTDSLGGKLSPFAFAPPSAPDQPQGDDLDAAWGEALRRARGAAQGDDPTGLRAAQNIDLALPRAAAAVGQAFLRATGGLADKTADAKPNGPKQLLLNGRHMANQQSQAQWGERQSSQGPDIDPETGWPIDPLTGEPIAPVEWERRQREEEARRIQEQRAREQGNEWGVRGDRLTFRRRF